MPCPAGANVVPYAAGIDAPVPERKEMRAFRFLNGACLLLFVVFTIGCAAYVVLHDHVVLNRFTDSWWHVAAADEYAKTGVFAKDPFFEDVPPFAQFGLTEFLCAKVSAWTGADTSRVFPLLVAVNAAVFLCAAFLAGYRLGGNAVAGCVSALSWAIVYPGHTLIGLGFPFNTAVALFALLFVSWDWSHGPRSPARLGLAWRGVLLGILFDLHVFVGLAGGAVAGLWFLWQLISVARAGEGGEAGPSRGRPLMKWLLGAVVFAVPALVLAWRWILLHYSLRAFLGVSNAHEKTTYPVEIPDVLTLGGGLLVLLLLLFLQRGRPEPAVDEGAAAPDRGPTPARLLPLLVLGSVLLLFCLPPFNGFVRAHTSWYMAKRIPRLFCLGPVLGAGAVAILSAGWRARLRIAAKAAVIILVLGMTLPAAKTWLLLQAYLARQNDYDEHVFGYLARELPDREQWEGKTVLADPNTSYLLRGMLKARVLTVIPGEASPAIDYAPRHALVKDALRRGPIALGGRRVDAVVLDIRNSATRSFAERPVADIVDTWTGQGWLAARETEEFILILPPETGTEE